jgi:hypothetical protein
MPGSFQVVRGAMGVAAKAGRETAKNMQEKSFDLTLVLR